MNMHFHPFALLVSLLNSDAAMTVPAKNTFHVTIGLYLCVLQALLGGAMLGANPLPSIDRFSTDDLYVVAGEGFTLSWEVSDVDTVRIEPGLGAVAASGSILIHPESSATYTLTATNRQGSGSSQVFVEVGPQLPPNVILILGDDMTQEDWGCYNPAYSASGTASTPNIDTLAAQGIRFDQAYCTESKCAASRASIMLGRPPHATFMPELNRATSMNETALYSRMNNMAHDFKRAGYYTIHDYKWHIGYTWNKPRGYFKQFYDRAEGLKTNRLGGEERWLDILREDQTPANRPIFCWFAPTDAHTPFTAPVYHGRADMLAPPPYVPDLDDQGLGVDYRAARAQYMDEIKRMDDYIGLLMQELQNNPKFDYDNTIIIVTADNGRPFSRDKWWNYDSSTRMPLVVHWPDGITQPGSSSDSMVSLMDLAPTLSEMLGNEPSDTTYMGKSFLSLLTGNPDQAHHEYIYTEYNWGDWEGHERCIRDDRYLYIRNARPGLIRRSPRDTAAGGDHIYHIARDGLLTADQTFFFEPSLAEEFYDRLVDPHQITNLLKSGEKSLTGEQLEVLNHLRAQLTQWLKDTGDTTPDVLTADVRKRLPTDPLPAKKVVHGELPGFNSFERFRILMGKNRLDPSDSSGTEWNGREDDPDGDGKTNYEEYVQGTDPLDPSS
jgi:N-sulfoglucosamine sulfohydrolase